MWKNKTLLLLSLLVISQTTRGNVLRKISVHLERVYDYILKNHEIVNVDCVFGVVLSQALLGEVDENAFGDRHKLQELKSTGAQIILKTAARLQKTSSFNKMFVELAFDPSKWRRKLRFTSGSLDANYAGQIVSRENFLRSLSRASFNESFSDSCISEVLRGTCNISDSCRNVFIDDPDFGTGYSTTHRILYQQILRLSGCSSGHTQLITKYCSRLLLETELIRYFGLIKELQDLLFEEVTLCGLEGFEEFLQHDFLKAAAVFQHEEGCYGFARRNKRAANVIGNSSCVDHTTGLGASVLSLFLKYHSQNN